MKTRRTPKLKALVEPGPTTGQLEELLTIAARVPDHGKLEPWRFIVVAGEARTRLGEAAARALAERGADAAKVEEARGRFSGVPVTVVAVSCVRGDPAEPTRPHPRVRVVDQLMSAGAVCMSYVIAAKAMGFGVVWLTEWMAEDTGMRAALGVGDGERIVGFLYTGTASEAREERPRPDMTRVVTRM